LAGGITQQSQSIAIGWQAGNTQQSSQAIAIGTFAGAASQSVYSIAIGSNAGSTLQGSQSIAIGYQAGQISQRVNATAIGYQAGLTQQGTNSIAIGYQAGLTQQNANSIILNATSSPLNSQTQSAFYAAPIRQSTAANTLYYDTTNKEIVYEGAPTIETINMSNYGQTVKLNSIPYASNQVITTSNVVAKLDNWVDNAQTYTFGPTVQARYVAVGKDGSATTAKSINYSADGLNWYAATSPFNTAGGYCNGIAYNGSVWVAVGSNVAVASAPTVTVAYSYDGINWNSVTTGTTFNGTVGGVAFGVAWGKDKFVAVGCSASATPVTNTIIYSYDGINWFAAANNIFATGSGSVAYGVCYNGSRWVVVGGQSIAANTPSAIVGYSADGITWTSGSGLTALAGAAFKSVAWNGTIFIMVGAIAATTPGTTAAYSADGITWTSTTTSGTNVFSATSGASGFGVCWNGSRWVAVGRNASAGATTITISTSVNGLIWTTVSTAFTFNGTTGCGTSVIWTGTKFIAVGQNSTATTAPTATVLYSYDGTSWFVPLGGATGNPFSTTAVFGSGNGIAYNSVRPNSITFPRNIVVAAGTYGSGATNTLYYSLDSGTTWTACTNQIFGAGGASCFCVATNGLIWVAGGVPAAGTSVTLGYSFDGIVWTAVQNSTSIFSTNVKGLAWSPLLELWVAVGTGTNQLAYSYDGINWVAVTLPSGGFTGSVGFDVAWGEDKFVACGGNANTNTQKMFYSYDGKNWTLVTSNTFTVGAYAIGFNGTMWVAVGNNTVTTSTPIATSPYYSYDGITWVIGSGASFSNNDLLGKGGVAWNGYRWVICTGTTTNTATITPILYSSDGINWTAATVSNNSVTYVIWAGNRFIAGYSIPSISAQIFTSTDGITWTVNASNTFGSECNGFAWSSYLPNSGIQNVNVAIQQPTLAFGSGANTIAYSYDGISWRGLGSLTFTTSAYGGCWNGKIWVAGGISGSTGVLAYSYDGINWTVASQSILTTAVYNVAWNGTVFVAVGGGAIYSIAYSYNGINWNAVANTAVSLGIATGQNVIWGQNYFVVTGAGTAFTNVATFTGSFGAGGTTLTVSGVTGTISIGQLVTGGTVSANTYIISGSGSTWTVNNSQLGGATATGTSGGGAAYSLDGINWTALTSIYIYHGSAGSGVFPSVAWGDNRWLFATNHTGGATFVLYTASLTGTFTYVSIASTSAPYCLCYGIYPSSSGTSGTTYSSIFLLGISGPGSGILYSTNSGATWSGPVHTTSYDIKFTGKRFVAVGTPFSTTRISYATNPTATANWTNVSNPTGAELFTTIRGLATATWPTLGSVYVDNAITLSSTSGLNTNNQLDIYSDKYFNNGYNNMALTIKATQIP